MGVTIKTSVASLHIQIPAGLTEIDVVHTFTAYLLGRYALHHDRIGRRPSKIGEAWHIDPTTDDFFLRFISDGEATLHCRYDHQDNELECMKALFEAQRHVR